MTKIIKFGANVFFFMRGVSMMYFWIFMLLEKVDQGWKMFFFLGLILYF